MAKEAIYAHKVFLFTTTDGEKGVRVFDIRGANAKARLQAELLSVTKIKRMVCEDGVTFRITYYKDRIN